MADDQTSDRLRANDGEILHRYGFGNEDVGGMSDHERNAAVAEATRNGIPTGVDEPEEGSRRAPIVVKDAADVKRAEARVHPDPSPGQGPSELSLDYHRLELGRYSLETHPTDAHRPVEMPPMASQQSGAKARAVCRDAVAAECRTSSRARPNTATAEALEALVFQVVALSRRNPALGSG
jgi:hypothetical protein